MDNFEIKIDKDGLWYYKGAHMFRKEILSIFFDHLRIDECGNYLIELGPERCYIEVEDTAFVVDAVYKTTRPGSNTEQIEVLLNDECGEILEMNSLQTGVDNVLYCRVKKGNFSARFSRKAYYQLAEFIEASDDSEKYYISLNGERYFIKEN
jgi:uncharacterized protein